MPRKSSIMAKLSDSVTSLTGMVEEAQKEMAGYMEDAEKYRELKPMLNKITNRIGQETTAQSILEESTGQSHDGGDNTGVQENSQSQIPVKKTRKKKGDNAAINSDDPPSG
jgi:hypothetical protein